MNAIEIPKVDQRSDWFEATVAVIEKETGATADWQAIDAEGQADGDFAGYYRKDGILFVASFSPGTSGADSDRIRFYRVDNQPA